MRRIAHVTDDQMTLRRGMFRLWAAASLIWIISTDFSATSRLNRHLHQLRDFCLRAGLRPLCGFVHQRLDCRRVYPPALMASEPPARQAVRGCRFVNDGLYRRTWYDLMVTLERCKLALPGLNGIHGTSNFLIARA